MLIGVDARELEGKPHGVGRVLSNLLRNWASTHQSHKFILYFRNKVPDLDFLNCPHFEKKLLPLPRLINRGRIWEQMVLPSYIKRDGIDVFLSPAYVIPLLANCPTVVMIFDISFQTYPETYSRVKGFFWRWLARQSVRTAKRIVCCSTHIKKEILLNYGLKQEEKVLTAFLGVERQFQPNSNESSRKLLASKFNITQPFFLFAGTLFRRRNIQLMVQSFKKFSHHHSNALLVIIGSPTAEFGHEVNQLKNLLQEYALKDKVIHFDYLSEEDLLAFFQSAICFVYPSTYEGFGLPVAEAMACGTPVIIPNTPTLVEIANGAAYVVDCLTQDNLCSAMISVFENMEIRKELQKKGLIQAQKFNWEKTSASVLESIETVFNNPKSKG